MIKSFSLNNVYFTSREVDVLSCIIAGRAVKKIANFLSVTPKTIENHIFNIKTKIGGNSRENIVDFVEQSDKYLIVKEHYLNLSTKKKFELILKNFSILIKEKNQLLTCVLICFTNNNDKDNLITKKIKEHLNISGINTIVTSWTNGKINNYFSKNVKLTSDYYVLYIISKEFIQYIEENKLDLLAKVYETISDHNITDKTIIFLVSDISKSKFDYIKSLGFTCLNLTTQEDYFYSFIYMLEIFVPNHGLNKNIFEFKEHYGKMYDQTNIRNLHENKELLKKDQVNELEQPKGKIINFKKLYILIGLCFLIYFIFYLIKFKHQEFILDRNQKENVIKNFSANQPYFDSQSNIFISTYNKLNIFEHYIQRKDISNKIWNILNAKEKTINSLKIVGLYGLSGVGKTFLAMNSIYNPKIKYNFRGWFPADNEDLLKSAYFELGEKLQLFTQDTPSTVKIDKIKLWMEKQGKILLIYDNVVNIATLQNYFPNNGNIIITSRNYKLPGAIEVDVMTTEEAVELLDKALPKQVKKDLDYQLDLQNLIEKLDRLPLAISQAGAYISENIINIKDYLSLFNEKKDKILLEKTLPPGSKNQPVYISWDISAQAIKREEDASKAIKLLDFIAYCYPNGIPKSLLTFYLYGNISNESKLNFNKNLNLLRKYSLLRLSTDTISIHRLVQRWVKVGHSETNKVIILKDIAATINKIYHSKHNFLQQSDFLRLLMVQAEFIFSQMQPVVKDVEILNLMVLLGEGYANLEEYAKSKEYLEKALVIQNNNYEQISKILNCLGQIYQRTGDYNKSKEYLLKSLSIHKKYHGNNENFINITTNLANTLIGLGQYIESKNLLEKALNLFEENDCSNHFQILRLLNSLGWNYIILGDYKKSKDYLEKALILSKKNYGEDHPQTAAVLNSLSNVYLNFDEYTKSKDCLKKALLTYEKYYGADHIRTAALLSNLGQVYSMIGYYAKSNELLERSLKIKKNIYGENHVRTAITISYISWNYFSMGNYDKSKQLLEKTIKIFKKQYGAKHITTAMLLNNLGWISIYLGNYKESEHLFKEALKIATDTNGVQHIDSIKISANLGNVYRMLNKFEDSKDILNQALGNLEKFYGSNNISTARIIASLGLLYGDIGNKPMKKNYLNKALEIFNAHLCENHFDVVKTIKELKNNKKNLTKNNISYKTPGYPVILDPKAL